MPQLKYSGFVHYSRSLGFNYNHAPILWCDNFFAIYLIANPVFYARTKHIEIDYHFVRERITSGESQVRFISSADQVADVLTKGLSFHRFNFLRAKLSVGQASPNLQGRVNHSIKVVETNSPATTKS